jgi:hypothetical protein
MFQTNLHLMIAFIEKNYLGFLYHNNSLLNRQIIAFVSFDLMNISENDQTFLQNLLLIKAI